MSKRNPDKFPIGSYWINQNPTINDWNWKKPFVITQVNLDENKIFFELLDGDRPSKNYFQDGSMVSDLIEPYTSEPIEPPEPSKQIKLEELL